MIDAQLQLLLPAYILRWGSNVQFCCKFIPFLCFIFHDRMAWKLWRWNKQIRLTEQEKSSLRRACQHSLLPFLTWQQFPLGSCRSPMHFPCSPCFPMELPQPIRFGTSAGTELLQLSICFPLASVFLPVHPSYFSLDETSLLLSVFLLFSPFPSLCFPGDTSLSLTMRRAARASPPCHPRVSPAILLQATRIPLLPFCLF